MQNVIPHIMPSRTVAVIGAGPAGLAAARWLTQRGFEPIIFEASAGLGGQWNQGAVHSAVWPGMRTNTSRIMTAFSDLDYPEGTATYPRHDEVLAYLQAYAEKFDLTRLIRFGTPVKLLDRAPGQGWVIHSRQDGHPHAEVFAQVVVASGRFDKPRLPDIAGLEGFSGDLDVIHTKDYRGAQVYEGKTVLVAGCSISALEIASDLAYGGAKGVVASYRRQRYVLPKLIAGVPTDHVMFTRAASLAGKAVPFEMLAAGMKEKVVSVSGCPSRFGAMVPHQNIFAAGITQSQHFLPAVAEGRIKVAPWIERIDGRTVLFKDGTIAEADGIICGTGYDISLPWVAPAIAETLAIECDRIDLAQHTFHPELPGLAFLGLYDAIGPTFPVMELQARWVAAALSGTVPMPSADTLRHGVEVARAGRAGPAGVPMHDLALLFAGNAGCEPSLMARPELQRALLSGPLSAVSFRLEGADILPDAVERTKAAAAAFGHIASSDSTPEESKMLSIILPEMQAA